MEGADGVGKTTFVELLMHFLDHTTVLHRGPPEKEPWLEYTEELEDYEPQAAPGEGPTVVCDRWHWGELVYGPLYRGESKLGWPGMLAVDRFLNDRGAIAVFLDGDEPTVTRRCFTERGEDYLQPEHVGWVLETYRTVALQSRVPVLHYQDPDRSHALDVVRAAYAFERSAAR